MLNWLRDKSDDAEEAAPIVVRLAVKDAAFLDDEEPDADLVMTVAGMPVQLRVALGLKDDQILTGWAGRDVIVRASRSGRQPRAEARLPYTPGNHAKVRLELAGFSAGRHDFTVEIVTARDEQKIFERRIIVQADA